MTGLLHRLAARATGAPGPVRPVARLPFSVAPALVEETTVVASAFDAAADPARLGPDPVPLGTAPVLLGPVRAIPAPSDDGPAESSTHAPGTGPRRSPDLVPPVAGPRPLQPVPVRPEPADSDAATDETSGTDDGRAWAGAVAPPASAEADAATVIGARVADPLGQADETPTRGRTELLAVPTRGGLIVPALRRALAPAPDDPELLLPAQAPAAPSPAGVRSAAAHGGASPDRQAGAGRVEEITEVHVSIGRIEITAAPSAPVRPPRRSATERKAMSLEDYLARKQSGRP